MSSRREVLIRILALLQRKTLIETKNRTLKCLKWHYSTVRSMKNVAVLTEDGAFALFFRPHPGGYGKLSDPTPGICHPRRKKMLMSGAPPGEWLLGAAGIDWCINFREVLTDNIISFNKPGQVMPSSIQPYTVNSRYCGHPRDRDFMSVIARVGNYSVVGEEKCR